MRGGKVEIDIDLNTKSFEAQIESAKNKLDTLEQEYEALKKTKPYKGQKEDLIYYEKEIEKTTNQIINLRKQEAQLQQKSSKGWTNAVKGIKKVGLKMLGLASIYGIVSRASSAYLSKDQELADKLQSVWENLGAMLAPALEVISDVLSKAVGYLNAFIKALTGVDLIARANAKALKQQAKAQKELNNETYDFDVIRKQQDTSGTTTGTTTSGTSAFTVPELDPEISAIFERIGGTIGKYTKQAIQNVKDLLHEIEEYNKALKTEAEIVETNTEMVGRWTNAYWEAEKQGKNTAKADELFVKSLQKTSQELGNNIDEVMKQRHQLFLTKEERENLTKKEQEYQKQLEIINDSYKKLYEQGKLNNEQTKNYKESLEKQIKVTQDLGGDVKELKEQYEQLDGKTYTSTIKVNADTTDAEKKFSLLDTWKKGWNILFGGNTQKYATGGLVTQPTRAIIGEAGYNEYVIPEREDYIARLASLINQHSGEREIKVYLDGRLMQRQVDNKRDQYNFATNR